MNKHICVGMPDSAKRRRKFNASNPKWITLSELMNIYAVANAQLWFGLH
jgi:hypothetical protein